MIQSQGRRSRSRRKSGKNPKRFQCDRQQNISTKNVATTNKGDESSIIFCSHLCLFRVIRLFVSFLSIQRNEVLLTEWYTLSFAFLFIIIIVVVVFTQHVSIVSLFFRYKLVLIINSWYIIRLLGFRTKMIYGCWSWCWYYFVVHSNYISSVHLLSCDPFWRIHISYPLKTMERRNSFHPILKWFRKWSR